MAPVEIKAVVWPYISKFLTEDEVNELIDTPSVGREQKAYKVVFTHLQFEGVSYYAIEYAVYTSSRVTMAKLFDGFQTVDPKDFTEYYILFMNARFPSKSVLHIYGRLDYDRNNDDYSCRVSHCQVTNGRNKLLYRG